MDWNFRKRHHHHFEHDELGRHAHGFGHRGGGRRGPHRGGFLDRFGGGGPRGGGRGLRAARMLASGDLQLIILSLLKEKPRYGYEIIKALEDHSSGLYTPSPGVVYPAFTYLEEMDYATAQSQGNKKLYSITPAGEENLEKNRKLVDETMEELAAFGKRMAFARNFVSEADDESEGSSDAHWDKKMEHLKEWKKTKMEFHTLKEELKSALIEKLDASAEERERIFTILRRAIQDIRRK